MALRQYVGARYVTKIYENSLDHSSAEWEANVNYEPLTMVTYNNGSYLSKQEVPANIGNPSSNPSYWTQTGFYNGQIASLQSQIDDINANLGDYITPDDFTGTDTAKLQAAFDYASSQTNSVTIIINREYTITSDITISHFAGTASEGVINLFGLGKDARIIFNGAKIKSNNITPGTYHGGITFTNIQFIGNNSAELFNAEELIRITCINCRFEHFANIIEGTSFIQQYTFDDCYIEECGKVIQNDSAIYQVVFDNTSIEHCTEVYRCGASAEIRGLLFTNCCIEEITNTAFIFNSNIIRNLIVENCYFESIPLTFDLSAVISEQYASGISICKNGFALADNNVGFKIPPVTYKLSAHEDGCIATLHDNHPLPTSGVGIELYALDGSPSTHDCYYDIDCLKVGYNYNSDLYKSLYQYNVHMLKFSYITPTQMNAGDTAIILSAADLATLTGTSDGEVSVFVRETPDTAAFTYRSSTDGSIRIYVFYTVPANYEFTFTITFRN